MELTINGNHWKKRLKIDRKSWFWNRKTASFYLQSSLSTKYAHKVKCKQQIHSLPLYYLYWGTSFLGCSSVDKWICAAFTFCASRVCYYAVAGCNVTECLQCQLILGSSLLVADYERERPCIFLIQQWDRTLLACTR